MNLTHWTLAGVVAVGACNGKPDADGRTDGGGLAVPRVRPPVQAALPPALIRGGTTRLAPGAAVPVDYIKTCAPDVTNDYCLTLTGTDRVRCHLKQTLFCSQPTAVLTLLDQLDSAMMTTQAGIRGTEACLSAVPADHTADLTFPGSKTFTHYLQCKDSRVPLGFGVKDGGWYIRTDNMHGGFLFSVDANDDIVNGYRWESNPNYNYNVLLRIAASRTAGTVEFVGSPHGFCAMHYASDQAHIWILDNEVGVGNTPNCDSNFDGTTNAADYLEICLDATTLDVSDPANCATLKNNTTLTLTGVDLSATPATGMIDFYDPATAAALDANAGTMAGVPELH